MEALAAYSKGFVAGLDGGLLALFDKDEREYYRRTRTFTVMEHPLPVRSARVWWWWLEQLHSLHSCAVRLARATTLLALTP